MRSVCVVLLLAAGVAAQSLTTTFNHNNGQSGNAFNVVATTGLTVTGMDLNLDPGTWDVEVHVVSGGGPMMPGVTWTTVSSATVISNAVTTTAPGIPTPFPNPLSIPLLPGQSTGIRVVVTNGTAMNYVNATVGQTVAAANADMTIEVGVGLAWPSALEFPARVWSGTLYYGPTGGPQPYQVNQANASMDFDGDMGTSLMPSRLTKCFDTYIDWHLDSALAGAFYEVAITAAPVVPGFHPGGAFTPGGQAVNLDLTDPTFAFYNGDTAPSFVPLNGPVTRTFAIPNAWITYGTQMVVEDPSHVDKYSLSQPCEVTIEGNQIITGPGNEDGAITIDLTLFNGCTTNQVTFCGSSYNAFFVNANGRVTFTTPLTDFTASAAEASVGPPGVGFWTDLSPQVGGATIETLNTQLGITVTYSNVPYYQESGSANTFSIRFDPWGGVHMDVAGIAANPLLGGASGGDAQWFGMSCGQGAVDLGPTAFAPGATGSNQPNPTAMFYSFASPADLAANGGMMPAISALQSGQGRLSFFPNPMGGYVWQGF